MNVFERALKYLSYKKSKSVIILILFTLIATANLVVVNFDSTINSYYQKMSDSTTNEVALSRVMNVSGGKPTLGGESITTEDINKITGLSYVSGSKQSVNVQATTTLDQITVDSTDNTDDSTTQQESIQINKGMDSGNTQIVGSSNLALESDIADEKVVSDGDVSKLKDDEVMISKALADLNNLKVGDTIKLTTTDRQTGDETTEEYKIAQLYTYSGDYDNVDMGIVPENTMYMNLTAAQKLETQPDQFTNVSFFIKDINDYNQLKKDVYSKLGISESDYTLDLNDETYKTIIKPLEKTVKVLKIVKNVILIAALIIIVIFISLALKERMYEISVLYSLGESKNNIILQFVLENLILYTIAVIIGVIISIAITNGLLHSSIIENFTQQASSTMGKMGGGPQMTQGGPMSATTTNTANIELSINIFKILINYILTIIVIGIINLGLLYKILIKNSREIMMDN